MIKIRKAKEKDLNKLLELDKKANKEIIWWQALTKSEFLRLIKKNLVYTAKQDEEIIGYLNANIKEKQLTLEDIYIRKNFRKKGIAKKLIEQFISENKSKFKVIRLDCPQRLRKFYEKLGFKQTAVIMKKEI